MAKATKLPSGNWRCQAAKTILGKRTVKSFTAPTKKEAEYLAAAWQIENESHSNDSISLKKAYEVYIESKENVLSPSTLKAYESMKNHTFTGLMNYDVTKLNQTLIQMSVNELAKNHSPKYVKNAYSLLAAVLGMANPNLTLKITLPQKKKVNVYIPDDEVISTILKHIENTPLEIPVLLAIFGPARRGEICALTSDDINGNTITINKALALDRNNNYNLKSPKTYSSYRTIEYPDFVIEKLKGIEGRLTDLSPDAITSRFLRVVKKLNLPNFRFHDLRHYAVSTLHSINIPDKYIMARGGWSTNHTMQTVYNHVLQSAKDKNEIKIMNHFNNIYGK